MTTTTDITEEGTNMITIYGASDDLVEVDGCEGADEFNVYPKGARAVAWQGNLAAPGEAECLRVHLVYDGCWHVGVGQVDEEVSMPPWPLTIRQGVNGAESDYSAVLLIDAPAGTRLVNVWPDGDDS
jgi:hypothetical protein